MKINLNIFQELIKSNLIWKKIKLDFQTNLIEKMNNQELNFDAITDSKVGFDFLKFLINFKKISLENFFEDLLNFLKFIALLNNRQIITQSDLFSLTKLDLEINDWKNIIKKALSQTMFREVNLNLEINGDFKDQLTIDFENDTISKIQIKRTEEIIKWLKASIVNLEQSQKDLESFSQLKNHFYQEEINDFYLTETNRLIQIMKFQLRAFSLVENL